MPKRTRYSWGLAYEESLQQQLKMYKDVEDLIKLHALFNDVKPPCEWKNGNICVAEGCFGEACLKMDLRKDQK